jgi:hypothetical protein
MANKILTPEQLTFYSEQGYLHAKGIIPAEVLTLARTIFGRWVDQTINNWFEAGLLKDRYAQVDLEHRLLLAWKAAGNPLYVRSPRRDLVGKEMFDFLTHPALLDIAEDLLGTSEISTHGAFNARPKLPDQKWTDTPWHQDAQYYRDAENTHVVSMWMPLQRVTEHNSCLQVAPQHQQDALAEAFKDETGFIGLPPEARKHLKGLSIEMDPGDVLCFTQRMPHRALSNQSDAVRWSMDIRYEATATATPTGQKQGFIVRSLQDPASVTPYQDWLRKWDNIPVGSY